MLKKIEIIDFWQLFFLSTLTFKIVNVDYLKWTICQLYTDTLLNLAVLIEYVKSNSK